MSNNLTIAEAEGIAAKRLDRRRRYFLWNVADRGEELCVEESCVQPCSGCAGCGCSECGHTGKRRVRFPVPVTWLADDA